MVTAESVISQLRKDIASANAATGKEDATMHEAVKTLIAGYALYPPADGLAEFPEAGYAVKGTDLDALSDAIAEKAGVEKPVWPDGFRSAVNKLAEKAETARQDALKRTAWYRPPDWPDITSLPFTASTRQAYYTVDKELPGADDAIQVIAYGHTEGCVELGYVESGEFVPVTTYRNNGVYCVTHMVDLTAVDTRFPVIRWTSSIDLDESPNEWLGNFYVDAPVVEVYFSGKWNRLYTFHYNEESCANIRAITGGSEGLDFSSSGLASRGFSKAIEYLDFSRCTSYSTISRDLYWIFLNSPALKEIRWPTVGKNSVLLGSATQSNWPDNAFGGCSSLRYLDMSIFDTSEVSRLTSCFDGCHSLKTLDISGWNLSACTGMSNTFRNCYSLENLITDGTVLPPVSFSLSQSKRLSVDSLLGIISALPTLAEGKTATLTLGATNTAKLTEEQLAVATEKGWTVA